jgi:hypothetical protein
MGKGTEAQSGLKHHLEKKVQNLENENLRLKREIKETN